MDSSWERLALSIGRGEALEVDCATHVFFFSPQQHLQPSGQVRHGSFSLRKLNGPIVPKHPTQQKTNTTTPTTHKQVTTHIDNDLFYDFLTTSPTHTFTLTLPPLPLPRPGIFLSSFSFAISILISAPHTLIPPKNKPKTFLFCTPMIIFKENIYYRE